MCLNEYKRQNMCLNYRLGDKPSLGVWRTFWVGEIGLACVVGKFG